MRLIIRITGLISFLGIFLVATSCMDDTPPDHNNNINPDKEDSRILPAAPTTLDEVRVITHDCKYYILASVTERGKEITVKKRFNSQMKWPCVLVYDTISLGQLKQGTFSVLLLIVDTNPQVTDSIFSKETLTLTVSK